MKSSDALFTFIKNSPSCFHAVREIENILDEAGFTHVYETEKWKLEKGEKYYVVRNGSSILAFAIGEEVEENYGFQIVASHSDSPTYKIKEHNQIEVKGKYTQLSTEGYGGMIASSWMDRPLSIAGRAMVKSEQGCDLKLIDFDRDMALIPNVAIHMNREINNGYKYNANVDMFPLYADQRGDFMEELAQELHVEKQDILGHDLFLYNRSQPSLWGEEDAFISSPRLDDLECAYTTLQGFLKGHNKQNICVYACFDNEEVGSGTRQGADSTFLIDTLSRINYSFGFDEETLYCALAQSFLVSADNAHALHPNHPEKSDANQAVYMNEGIVIKFNANQKYTSDAISKGIFQNICEQANVPVQYYANRSDMMGGSTLGNISTSHVSIKSVDIGLAQLAMHSSYETAGRLDIDSMIAAITAFYETNISEETNGNYHITKGRV